MATSIQQEMGGLTTLLTTELNSLANNAGTVLSAEFDNDTSSTRWLAAEFELSVTFGTNPTADSVCEIYIVRAVDGSTYSTYTSGSSAVANNNDFNGTVSVKASTSAQVVVSRRIQLPPGKWKVALINRTAQAFPASGSTLKMRPSRLQTVTT